MLINFNIIGWFDDNQNVFTRQGKTILQTLWLIIPALITGFLLHEAIQNIFTTLNRILVCSGLLPDLRLYPFLLLSEDEHICILYKISCPRVIISIKWPRLKT